MSSMLLYKIYLNQLCINLQQCFIKVRQPKPQFNVDIRWNTKSVCFPGPRELLWRGAGACSMDNDGMAPEFWLKYRFKSHSIKQIITGGLMLMAIFLCLTVFLRHRLSIFITKYSEHFRFCRRKKDIIGPGFVAKYWFPRQINKWQWFRENASTTETTAH